MDRLTAMRVFVAVLEEGSQTGAADKLDMSRAMVTRYLAELENWLGERLLHRTTRRLSLTDAGQECLRHCKQVLEQVSELENSAGRRHAEPRGLLRITASMSFGQAFLAPAIVAYRERYPQVQIDMQLLDRTVNLIEERLDLALRISNDLDPSLVARRLGTCQSVIACSPAYLQKQGIPQTLQELTLHHCLTYSFFGKSQWHFVHKGQSESVQVGGGITANEVSCLLAAALAGGGIGMLPRYLAAPYLQSGALLALLPQYQVREMGIHAVYASRRHQSPALRSLLDFLAERMADLNY